MYTLHHPVADIDRLYIKWEEALRGLVQIEVTCKAELVNIAECLNTKCKEDQFVNIVKSDESSQQNISSTIKTAAKVTEE